MNIKSKLLTTVLASSVLFSTNVFAKDVIHVATEPTFAPFDFVEDKTSKVVGFDIDIINAIGEIEGFDVDIVSMQFDGIIPSILSNSVDAAISGLTKNPEREKMVLFSDPYYVAGQDMMIRKADEAKYKVLDDLQGQKICVQIGSVGAEVAGEVKGAKVINYNTMTEAYIELGKGVCEASITGSPVNEYYLNQTKDEKLTHVAGSMVRARDLGIITNKNNTALMNKINHGLKTIKENGQYDKIYAKWFK